MSKYSAGVAWLLLYKDKWFQNEVYNDINGGLVNLFSVIRFHPDELLKEIELIIHSQKLFHYYKDTLHLTDIQKAAGTLINTAGAFRVRERLMPSKAVIAPKPSYPKSPTSATLPKRRNLQRILRKVH